MDKFAFCLFIGGGVSYLLELNTFYALGFTVVLLILLRGVEIGKAPYKTRKRSRE